MKTTRITLDPETSEVIREAGDCFAVLARGSYPDAAGRIVLHLVPSTIERIDKAVSVARGELLTRKPPTPPATSKLQKA